MTQYRDEQVLQDVAVELSGVRQKWPPMASLHEGYAILLEEVDEFWDEVKKKESLREDAAMYEELIQIAAMAVKIAAIASSPR